MCLYLKSKMPSKGSSLKTEFSSELGKTFSKYCSLFGSFSTELPFKDYSDLLAMIDATMPPPSYNAELRSFTVKQRCRRFRVAEGSE